MKALRRKEGGGPSRAARERPGREIGKADGRDGKMRQGDGEALAAAEKSLWR
jgi:hypothetical protein